MRTPILLVALGLAACEGGASSSGADDAFAPPAPDAGRDADVPPADDAALADAARPDAAAPDAAAPDAGPPPIPPVLTEVMARNDATLRDADGDFSDWIEVFNPTAAPLPLAGWCLTDDLEAPCKWPFPAGATLAPGEHRVVFASDKDRAGPELHTNFKLDAAGEDVAIGSAAGIVQAFEGLPPQVADRAWGLPATVERAVLVEEDTPARAAALEGLAGDWRAPDYDDASWTAGPAALGDAPSAAPAAPTVLADARADFDGGAFTHGVVDLLGDGVFTPLEDFDGYTWRSPGGSYVTAGVLYPAGVESGVLEAAVRRWVAPAAGRVRLTGVVGPTSHVGDGVVARILVDGRPVYENALKADLKRYVVELDLVAGAVVDFVVDPGPDGASYGDETRFTARIEAAGAESALPGPALADSAAHWSLDGVQGGRGFTYGTYGPGGAFTAFPRSERPHGDDDWWDGRRYLPPGAGSDGLLLDALEARPAADRWPARRYVLPEAGRYVVRWHVAKVEPWGDGVTARLLHDGQAVDGAPLAADDVRGVERVVLVEGRAGQAVDLVLAPGGDPDGDLATTELRVFALPAIGAAAVPPGDGAFAVRVPFTSPAGFTTLHLRAHHVGAFDATLDGAPFAAGEGTGRRAIEAPGPAPGRHLLAAGVRLAGTDRLFAPVLEARRATYPAPRAGFLPPTPGAANVPVELDGPPAVRVDARHPAVSAGDPIRVSATVLPGAAPIARVEAVYRVGFGPEAVVPLAGDGETFTGTLPDAGAGELVRFLVRATDAEGRVATAPAFDDPEDDERWYGTVVAPAVDSPLEVLHVFLGRPDDAGTGEGTRGAVFWRGELYDNVRFDVHGQSSYDFPKRSYNVDFHDEHRFRMDDRARPQNDVDLLTNYGDKSKLRNSLAYRVYGEAGAGAHLVVPTRVHLNGAFFALYDMLDDGDGRYLERLGLDPDGELYKMDDGFASIRGAEKRTRRDEDKQALADIEALLDGPEPARAAMDHVNLFAMVNFLAAHFVVGNLDCCHKNYYAYYDREGTGEWWFLPWDVDLSFGRVWTDANAYFDDRLFLALDLQTGAGNRLVDACFAVPGFGEMYRRRVRTLLDRFVQPPGTPSPYLEARIDELVALVQADAALDDAAWETWGAREGVARAVQRLRDEWLPERRAFVYGRMTPDLGDGDALPAAQGSVRVRVEAVAEPPHLRLVNEAGEAVDLSDYTVRGAGVSRRLSPGTVIPAGGTLRVVGDRRAWRAARGGRMELVQGNWTGTFDARGEAPALAPP